MVELAGRPLVSHSVAAVEEAGLQPLVVAKLDTELPALRCTVIREDREPRHPLCGILAALDHAEGQAVVAIGCDMPLVPPQLLAWLATRSEPLVAPSLDGRTLPFPARYHGLLRPSLERALVEQRSMAHALASLSPRLVGDAELAALADLERLCFNVNTAADLARAEALLAA